MIFASKPLAGLLAAAMLTGAVASPAEAQHRRYHRDRGGNGISLGDVVVGAIAVAGAATVIGALSNGSRRGTYGYPYDDRYGRDTRRDDRQASIEACAYEAEREAGRRFGSNASIGRVDDVDRSRDGYRIRGTVEVQSDYAYDGYRRGRYEDYDRGSERVAFSCTAYGGRVTGLSVGSAYAQGY